ncbi:MAG: protein kinase, partial [Proteobacteria bacterium]|nr:protein kinase [Pseudomonadota bacterium]
QTPFSKVYKNQFQTSLFRDKIVIIGPTAPGLGDRFVTPISGELPGVDVIANSVENILNNRFFLRPPWIILLEFGCLILFGLFVALALPKLRGALAAVFTLLLLLSWGAAGIILFLSHNLWLKISPPMLLLVFGYVLVASKKFFVTERTRGRVEADSVETNKMLGLSFQQQGMLDLALEKFRKLPLAQEGVKDLIYNLGLDFEGKRELPKALAAYNLLIEDERNFRDLNERIPKLKGAEASMIFGAAGGGYPGDIGATPVETGTKHTLGRYEVVGELGRGAMGVVYRGEDPKSHRTVALKTIRLSDFDEEILDQIRERFFREAESAALLTHPHIATTYDCGEEHDLAYMAMEFLNGKNLEEHTKKENLLPIPDTLSLVVQAAEALDYAHGKGTVHRNIKPANIVRLNETGKIKVTDFGVARIMNASKPGTEILPGTLYYMSPEQIAGKKVDGRSDIFSLGVVLFELLTGQKPFRGDDLTSLMYQIAKEPHGSPRDFNPRIPQVIEKILDKALEKDRGRRYQRAGQMAAHLRKVIAKIEEMRARKGVELRRKAPGLTGPTAPKADVVLH